LAITGLPVLIVLSLKQTPPAGIHNSGETPEVKKRGITSAIPLLYITSAEQNTAPDDS
jgi:hypothetical protein